ncbi:hypothetical protein SDC9_144470 [bioreactor metagenome]|uniref:Uncharacterized protein n=1 Tax=bioreactor metagenome TaxID=1076179 RepID=A0A645E6B3_9ZZZZ
MQLTTRLLDEHGVFHVVPRVVVVAALYLPGAFLNGFVHHDTIPSAAAFAAKGRQQGNQQKHAADAKANIKAGGVADAIHMKLACEGKPHYGGQG